jgi:voltage-gated potassium channel
VAKDQTDTPLVIWQQTRRRMLLAMGLLILIWLVAASGYWYLGWRYQPGYWRFDQCVYMTAITISTVGFNETLDLDTVEGARTWTLGLLVFGISANLYVLSSITSFFVESDFANVRRYRRHLRRMQEISGHYIVCGAGRTGIQVVNELIAVGHDVVAIDADKDVLDALEARGILTVQGDATEDAVLESAGLSRAKGIVATLDDDKTNMYVVVTARQANPKLRIVTKAVSQTAGDKLRRAGANAVVSPTFIGGMRLASEMVRPQVVRFLDEMLRDREANLRIEEAIVGDHGDLVGKKLRDAAVRDKTGALIIAVRSATGTVDYVPSPDLVLEAGQTLVVIGTPGDVARLRECVGHRGGD